MVDPAVGLALPYHADGYYLRFHIFQLSSILHERHSCPTLWLLHRRNPGLIEVVSDYCNRPGESLSSVSYISISFHPFLQASLPKFWTTVPTYSPPGWSWWLKSSYGIILFIDFCKLDILCYHGCYRPDDNRRHEPRNFSSGEHRCRHHTLRKLRHRSSPHGAWGRCPPYLRGNNYRSYRVPRRHTTARTTPYTSVLSSASYSTMTAAESSHLIVLDMFSRPPRKNASVAVE